MKLPFNLSFRVHSVKIHGCRDSSGSGQEALLLASVAHEQDRRVMFPGTEGRTGARLHRGGKPRITSCLWPPRESCQHRTT